MDCFSTMSKIVAMYQIESIYEHNEKASAHDPKLGCFNCMKLLGRLGRQLDNGIGS